MKALVGAEKRIALVAQDIVEHFERRQEIIDGKAIDLLQKSQIRETSRLKLGSVILPLA
ncbi:hypothetical protein [Nostoc sp.]|uniref:hypothetical protein n=1 Tax=Nostoc sp. TaxID=1180 RepID=UPI002FF57238